MDKKNIIAFAVVSAVIGGLAIAESVSIHYKESDRRKKIKALEDELLIVIDTEDYKNATPAEKYKYLFDLQTRLFKI